MTKMGRRVKIPSPRSLALALEIPMEPGSEDLTGARPSDSRKVVAAVISAGLSAHSEMAEADVPDSLKGWLHHTVAEHGGAMAWRDRTAFLGLWGAEESRDDDPENAIRAALSIRDRMQEFNRGRPGSEQLHLRIGISAGPVFLAGEAGLEASGDAVDAASWLQGKAPKGGVLLSESAYRYVRGVFDVAPQESLTVLEKGEPLGIYLVERAKPRAFQMPIRGVGNIETRTVGRERELQRLKDLYREAMEESRTRVVLLTGDGGVGKSRLLYEFEKWLELLPERIMFFESQAVPETARRPHGVFRDLFSFRFEIMDSDDAEKVRRKFRAGLADLLDPARADVMGHWLGFDFSGSEAVTGLLGSRSFRQQAQADLCRVFGSLATRPVVLFLEDLHWADDSSLDLLEYLAGEVPNRQLMFVCLARPSLFERRKDWGAEHPAFARLHLEPLTESQCRDLVDEILKRMDAIPEGLRELVTRSAQGNPFYVEELILLLVDKGVILAGEERWQVDAEKLSKVELPETLSGILRARLDCLPSKERLLLQCASVVGRQFWGAAVAELSASKTEALGVPPEGLDALLQTARERQLVFPTSSSSFEHSQEFSFKHAILRDIVYDSVVQTVKKAYHAGAAMWLERNLRERKSEYLSVIAEHFEAAGERERAASYLVRSGEELAKVSAFHEAVTAFERALHLVPEDQERLIAELLTDLGDVCRILGDHAVARRWLERAIDLSRKNGETRTEVMALNALARTDMIQGRYTEAKPHLAQALKLASRHGLQDGAAKVLLNLADVSFRLGDADTAMTSGQQSLEIARELKDAQAIAGAHRVLGFACMMKGDLPGAAGHHGQGFEIFETIGDRWGMGTCLINLGEVYRKMGKVEEAVNYWEKSLPIAQDIGARLSVAIAYVNTGGTLAGREGQEDRALANLRLALKEATAIGAVPIVLEGLVGVAKVYALEGQQPLSARLLGTVTGHPSFNAEIQEYSDPLMNQLRKKLGAETLRSLLDQGRGQELAAVVGDIVGDK
jgi:tetratricopeptide (TPR) repeat protein/class 3 adenylate cyclase